MKRLWVIILFILTCLSCTDYVDSVMKEEGITDVSKAWKWVADNITYVEDKVYSAPYDDWQPAEETLRLRTGDCDDFSILLGEMFHRLGHDVDMCFVYISQPHAILDFYGFLIEPGVYDTFYLRVPRLKGYRWSYADYRLKSQISFARRD